MTMIQHVQCCHIVKNFVQIGASFEINTIHLVECRNACSCKIHPCTDDKGGEGRGDEHHPSHAVPSDTCGTLKFTAPTTNRLWDLPLPSLTKNVSATLKRVTV